MLLHILILGVVDHKMLIQPACKDCEDPLLLKRQIKGSFHGRPYNVVKPKDFWEEFQSQTWQRPSEDHDCDDAMEDGVEFKKWGDVCRDCRELNSTDIEHQDGSKTYVYLEKVAKQGPSNMNR